MDDAITLLQGTVNSAPRDSESYNLLCRAYFMLGEWIRHCRLRESRFP